MLMLGWRPPIDVGLSAHINPINFLLAHLFGNKRQLRKSQYWSLPDRVLNRGHWYSRSSQKLFMGFARKPTFHQKQMRFFAFLFGGLAVVVVIALLWLLNR
jgi:hypothetical protein